MSIRLVDERSITKHIVKESMEFLLRASDIDVAVVGGGPAGLTAARYLAMKGFIVVVFEKKLSFGGGIGGGGMLLPRVVVQKPANEILEEVGCRLKEVESGVYAVSTAELIAKLASGAIDVGAEVMLGTLVEDVVFRKVGGKPRVSGVVIQWTAVALSGLHVDPLGVMARAVVDATGHDAEVLNIVRRKIPELGVEIKGERSMYAEESEKKIVEHTGKVCEGLYVAGMSVAALHGLPRMGPIFGGMLLSGKKVADVIAKDLGR